MKFSLTVFIAAIFLLTPLRVSADQAADVDYANLAKRLDKLEKENQILKEKVEKLTAIIKSDVTPSTAVEGKSNLNLSEPGVSALFYGFVQADMVYENDAQRGNGITFFAELGEDDTDEFIIAGSQTRFGFDFDGLTIGETVTLSAKIEGDFLGESYSASSDKSFRIRQAYAKASGEKFSLTAGKAWNFMSPLYPDVLTGAYLWFGGNMGYRNDQLILGYDVFDDLNFQIGLIDADSNSETNLNHPIVGSYLTYHPGNVELGLGVFYGNEEIVDTGDKSKILGVTGSLTAKVHNKVSLKAEGYVGQNMDSFYVGGLALSGVKDNQPIKGRGGFAQVMLLPSEKSEIVVGAGIDDIYSTKLDSYLVWDYNFTWFANCKYNFTSNYMWGLEFQRFQTKYFDTASSKENTSRVQVVNRYSF